MSRHSRKAGARRDRTNLYSETTDKIITELRYSAGRPIAGAPGDRSPSFRHRRIAG